MIDLYPAINLLHVPAVVTSGVLFALRGSALQAGGNSTHWLPMQTVLSPGDDIQKSSLKQRWMFYAQASTLVHYIQNRPEHSGTITEDMTEYLALVDSGTGG